MKFLPNDLIRNWFWWKKAYKKGLELYNSDFIFDVVHCHDLDTLKTGVWLKKKLGVKLVYDAHEIFAYMIARNMPKIIVNYALNMEKKLINKVDHILTVNEPLREYFKKIFDKKITIIMNCKDIILEEYKPTNNDVFTLSYIGVLHKSRMFPEIIDIVGSIDNVKMFIAGKKENLFEEVKLICEKYDNIDFLGPIPFNQVVPKTLMSDAILCMIYPNDPNNKIGLANKQFEAMVCGRPIICTKDTFSGKMTSDLKCGIAVDYNKESLINGIIKLRDDKDLCKRLGENALKLARERFNWNIEKEKLIDFYDTLI
jgi:glycosyltransferase involved in cell wall biosynthesis